MENYKTEANAAIQRLRGITSTVQQAVSSNDETQSALRDLSVDYSQSVENLDMLENLVHSIEVTMTLHSLRLPFTPFQDCSRLVCLWS